MPIRTVIPLCLHVIVLAHEIGLHEHRHSDARANNEVAAMVLRALQLQEWLEQQIIKIVIGVCRFEKEIDRLACVARVYASETGIDATAILRNSIHVLKREVEHESCALPFFGHVKCESSAKTGTGRFSRKCQTAHDIQAASE